VTIAKVVKSAAVQRSAMHEPNGRVFQLKIWLNLILWGILIWPTIIGAAPAPVDDPCPCCIERGTPETYASFFYFIDENSGNFVRKDYENGQRKVVSHYDTDHLVQQMVEGGWVIRDSIFRRNNGSGNRFLVAYNIKQNDSFAVFDKEDEQWKQIAISRLAAGYQRIQGIQPIDYRDGDQSRALILVFFRQIVAENKDIYDIYAFCANGAAPQLIMESVEEYHYNALENTLLWTRQGKISFFDFENTRLQHLQDGFDIQADQHLSHWGYSSRYLFGLVEKRKSWGPASLRVIQLLPDGGIAKVADPYPGENWKRLGYSRRSRSGAFNMILAGSERFGHLGFNPQNDDKLNVFSLPHPLIGKNTSQIGAARLLYRRKSSFLAVLEHGEPNYTLAVYKLKNRFDEDPGQPLLRLETELPSNGCEVDAVDHKMIVYAAGSEQTLGLLSINRKRTPEYHKISTIQNRQ